MYPLPPNYPTDSIPTSTLPLILPPPSPIDLQPNSYPLSIPISINTYPLSTYTSLIPTLLLPLMFYFIFITLFIHNVNIY